MITDTTDNDRNRSGDPKKRAGSHGDPGKGLAEKIHFAVRNPAFGEQVIVQKHGGKALDVLKRLHHKNTHRDGNELLERPQRDDAVEAIPRQAERHQKCHSKDRDHRLVSRARLLLFGLVEAEVDAHGVISPNPFAVDKRLRRRLYVMLFHERIGSVTGRQMMLFDIKSLTAPIDPLT